MEFGWINLFGGLIVVLILIPNIVYAVKTRGRETAECEVPKVLTVCEQVGRYGCMLFMWLPLFVWKFGFGSMAGLLLYLFGNGALLLAYYAFWIAYAKKKTLIRALTLAIIPTCIFLLSGLTLRYPLLIAFSMLFGCAHTAITVMTHREK